MYLGMRCTLSTFEIMCICISISCANSLALVAPYDVNAAGNNMYPQGEQLMLSCLSEGGPQLEYSWIFSGSEIATTPILTINNVSASNGGDYTCNVTNDAGSESDTITVYSKFINHNLCK